MHPGNPPHAEQRRRDHGPGIAGAEERRHPSLLHQAHADRQRRIPLAADGRRRVLVHGHRFGGVLDQEPVAPGLPVQAPDFGPELVAVPDQNDRDPRVEFIEGSQGPLDDDPRTGIAAHAVDADDDGGLSPGPIRLCLVPDHCAAPPAPGHPRAAGGRLRQASLGVMTSTPS